MLDFIVFVVFIFLVLIMFKKYCIPVLKEEIKQAEIRTNKLNTQAI